MGWWALWRVITGKLSVIRQTGCSFGESLGGLGLILVQFGGVLGWVRINFNAILGSPWAGLGLILVPFGGVLGWVWINFNAILGSHWAGLGLILVQFDI